MLYGLVGALTGAVAGPIFGYVYLACSFGNWDYLPSLLFAVPLLVMVGSPVGFGAGMLAGMIGGALENLVAWAVGGALGGLMAWLLAGWTVMWVVHRWVAPAPYCVADAAAALLASYLSRLPPSTQGVHVLARLGQQAHSELTHVPRRHRVAAAAVATATASIGLAGLWLIWMRTPN